MNETDISSRENVNPGLNEATPNNAPLSHLQISSPSSSHQIATRNTSEYDAKNDHERNTSLRRSNRIRKNIANRTHRNYGREIRPTHQVSSHQDDELVRIDTQTRVCQFYQRTGRCRYGNGCRFIHQDSSPIRRLKYSNSRGTDTRPRKPREYHDPGSGSSSTSGHRPVFHNRGGGGGQRRGYCRYFWRRNYQKNVPSETNKSQLSSETSAAEDSHLVESHAFPGDNLPASSNNVENCPEDSTGLESTSVNNEIANKLQNLEISDQEEKLQSPVITHEKEVILPSSRQGYLIETLNEEKLRYLRETEIIQLKRRFPGALVQKEDEHGVNYCVKFSPSDPDWPFEITSVTLEVLIPSEYPKEACEVKVIDEEERMPAILLKHLNKEVKKWIEEKHASNKDKGKCELLFRPFLRWLDRNLEDLFTNGLRAAKRDLEAMALGIEFVVPEDLPGASNTSEKGQDDNVPKDNSVSQDVLVNKDDERREEGRKESEECLAPRTVSSKADDANAVTKNDLLKKMMPNKQHQNGNSSSSSKRGIEIKFRSFNLGEGIATLSCNKLSLVLQCSRCKTSRDIVISSKANYNLKCEKCSRPQTVAFRPDILHQFSAVLGYLDMTECNPVDIPLMNCEFTLTCVECNTQGPIDGIHYGQQHTTWCFNCNTKLTVFVDSVKFLKLQNTYPKGAQGQTVTIQSKLQKVKDPAIQEGKPLPDFGTCRHFKKSFRWLRFPCCGKAYPCDVCHDEKETDHEMKYATRMICGYCSKEQPYSSQNPCIACHSNVTKKASAHWEGGKGCRDKNKMSRDDVHKYSGRNKTVSRKSAATTTKK